MQVVQRTQNAFQNCVFTRFIDSLNLILIIGFPEINELKIFPEGIVSVE